MNQSRAAPAEMNAPSEWGPPRHKTITWYDVPAGQEARGGLSGLEYLQGIMEGRFPPPPIASLVGSRLVSVKAGEAVFRCTPDESFLNPLGLVHGGLLCTLMDSAMGVAVQTTAPAGTGYASIELKVSFLRPLPFDGTSAIEVTGRTLRTGRRIAFAEARAVAGDGQLVGHATSSLAAVTARS
jgi:uncharacterized protein (TIGR00369 family)